MSENEVVKKIKYICDNWYDENLEIDVKWIQALLELYQKEKEKNKEIEIRLQEEINEVCEMKTRLFGNSIGKDKIKAKIEELNLLKHKDDRLDRASIDFVINKIYRLLEEE